MAAADVSDVLKRVNAFCRRDGRGYNVTRVSWDDVQRSGGFGAVSAVGPNITDTRLRGRGGELLYTVRPENWNEKLGIVKSDDVAVVVGAHRAEHTEADLSSITLRDFLGSAGAYGGYAGMDPSVSLAAPGQDDKVSIRFQTCFLPVAARADGRGTFEFYTEMYNYQTRSDDDPRNLIVLCTSQGSFVQQDGSGFQRMFLHHPRGPGAIDRFYMEAEQSRHHVGGQQVESAGEVADAVARGKAVARVLGIAAMGTRFNALMTLQVPLRQRQRAVRRSGGGGGFGTGFAFGSSCGMAVPSALSASSSSDCFGAIEADSFSFSTSLKSTQVRSRAAGRGGRGRDRRVVSKPAAVRSYAARVSRGSRHDTWPGLRARRAERDPSQCCTLTVVLYYAVPGGVPREEDILAAVADMEDLYARCSWTGRLAHAPQPVTTGAWPAWPQPQPQPQPTVRVDRAFPKTAGADRDPFAWVGPVPAPPAPAPAQITLAERTDQQQLFTAAVRRDAFRVLTGEHCAKARAAYSAVSPAAAGARWVVRYLASGPVGSPTAPSSPLLKLVALRPDGAPAAPVPPGLSAVHPSLLEQGIASLGRPTPFGHAFTVAFEDLLAAQLVPGWGDEDVAELSDDFLVAFGNELTPRLDIHHRIKTQQLSRERVERLRANPFVDKAVLATFQD